MSEKFKLGEYLHKIGAVDKYSAIPRRKIALDLGVSIRELKKLAERSRLGGERPVVSYCGRGYFGTTDRKEVANLSAKIRRECLNRLRQLRGLKGILAEGQMELF